MSARIIIGGDIVPTKTNEELFTEANVDELIGTELKELLSNADYTMFNLEVPLTDKEHPISKYGPNLIASTTTISGLSAINPHFFTLANNHILDQGEYGLYSTIEVLEEAGIDYAGAGRNLQEASKGFLKEINGIIIGIYCCAEHEFSIATDSSAGANPFDPLESLDHISALKDKADYVIVLYHGGKEHYRYPSPYLQKVCRKIVDKGADLVVCQHSHCIGCEEKWNDGTIVYGQGNFLFDSSESVFWQNSLLIELAIEDKSVDINYVPLKKNENKVRLVHDDRTVLSRFKERSDEIKDARNVKRKYKELSDSMIYMYLANLESRRCKLFAYRVINKLTGHRLVKYDMDRLFKRKKHAYVLLNYFDCEAHRELIVSGLERWML